MAGLSPLEKKLLNQVDKEPANPVVFIVGPPRSGTTLVYELLVRRYKFSYISNLAQKFHQTPLAVTKVGKNIIDSWHQQAKSRYKNRYGNINGWGAPSEGGCVWNRWFPESHYLDESHIEKIPQRLIQNTVYGLEEIMKGTFINKNVMHSVHMKLLDLLFPNCLFIHINRDTKSNIRSILRAHSKFATDKNDWFSVKPREWEQYKNEDIVLRSTIQVHYTHKNIEEDADYLGDGRVYPISYEDVCQDSGAALDAICVFLNENGVKVEERNIQFPELSISVPEKTNDDIEEKIDKYLSTLL